MKRSSLIGCFASALLVGCPGPGPGSSTACDPGSLMDKAQLCPDRLSFGFRQEFNSATFIGQGEQARESLYVRSGGLEDLNIESVNFTHDPAFEVCDLATSATKCKGSDGKLVEFVVSMDFPDGGMEPPATVRGNEHFFVQVLFTPKLPKLYNWTLTVKSNAQNHPPADAGCGDDWCFLFSGCGVSPDGGSSCYPRDAGR